MSPVSLPTDQIFEFVPGGSISSIVREDIDEAKSTGYEWLSAISAER